MFWRKRIIRFQATTSDARLFTTWQPCIGEWNSKTPQRLPKVPPPQQHESIHHCCDLIWSLTQEFYFVLFSILHDRSSFGIARVYTCLHGELVSSPLQTLLSSNTERNPTHVPRAPWIIRHFDTTQEIAILRVRQIVRYCEWMWMVWQPRCWPASAVFEGYVYRSAIVIWNFPVSFELGRIPHILPLTSL